MLNYIARGQIIGFFLIAGKTPEGFVNLVRCKLETNRREAAGKKGTAKQAVVKQPKKGTYVAKIRRARRNDSLR